MPPLPAPLLLDEPSLASSPHSDYPSLPDASLLVSTNLLTPSRSQPLRLPAPAPADSRHIDFPRPSHAIRPGPTIPPYARPLHLRPTDQASSPPARSEPARLPHPSQCTAHQLDMPAQPNPPRPPSDVPVQIPPHIGPPRQSLPPPSSTPHLDHPPRAYVCSIPLPFDYPSRLQPTRPRAFPTVPPSPSPVHLNSTPLPTTAPSRYLSSSTALSSVALPLAHSPHLDYPTHRNPRLPDLPAPTSPFRLSGPHLHDSSPSLATTQPSPIRAVSHRRTFPVLANPSRSDYPHLSVPDPTSQASPTSTSCHSDCPARVFPYRSDFPPQSNPSDCPARTFFKSTQIDSTNQPIPRRANSARLPESRPPSPSRLTASVPDQLAPHRADCPLQPISTSRAHSSRLPVPLPYPFHPTHSD
jgi:hypothetical protein